MKTIKDKQILVGADFAGFPLKEAVVAHLKKKGWTVTDVCVRTGDEEDTDLMFHHIGLRVGAMISEGEFERGFIGSHLCHIRFVIRARIFKIRENNVAADKDRVILKIACRDHVQYVRPDLCVEADIFVPLLRL